MAYAENPIPAEHLNRIFGKSSEAMTELPDNSVHLMVTSPPYNVGKEYDRDATWRNTWRFWAGFGGRSTGCWSPGAGPASTWPTWAASLLPLHVYIIQGLLDLGFLMRGEIIWNKASSASPSTAWGSWRSPATPACGTCTNTSWSLPKGVFPEKPDKRPATISRDDFLEFTKRVWTFPAVSARSVGHPAPFPMELPHRLIQLYTFEGEVVLDPFLGSGQTAIAALLTTAAILVTRSKPVCPPGGEKNPAVSPGVHVAHSAGLYCRTMTRASTG